MLNITMTEVDAEGSPYTCSESYRPEREIGWFSDTVYTSPEGYRMAREYGWTVTTIVGRWVLRDPNGQQLDSDHYREKIAERHGLQLVHQDRESLAG